MFFTQWKNLIFVFDILSFSELRQPQDIDIDILG